MKGLNVRGVTEFCRAVVQKPHLLLPQISVKGTCARAELLACVLVLIARAKAATQDGNYKKELFVHALKDRGFQGVVFDKDNTLTVPHHNEIAAHLQKPLDECKQVFGDRVLIFSNSAGSNDDPGFAKAREIEAKLQIPVLKHNGKKPGGIVHVQAHFENEDPTKLVMIGDRYSTDVLFGNMNDQFTCEGESIVNRQLQRIEKAMIRMLLCSGVAPLEHPLMAAHASEDDKERK
ncbi:Had phosphatase, family iiia, partial [Globisporangium splendens]